MYGAYPDGLGPENQRTLVRSTVFEAGRNMKPSTVATLLLILGSLVALASCGAGGVPPGGGSGAPAPIVVSVSPVSVYVQVGTQRQFTATVQGGGSNPGGVNWSVPGGPAAGTINSTGLYSAPSTVTGTPTITVRATSQNDPTSFDDAAVTIVSGPVYGQLPAQFEVRTRGGWQANLAPVTVGIPLPKTVHSDAGQLRIQRQLSGANVPAQFNVVSRWDDGSIRWVQADFVADLSAPTGIGDYQLNNGGTGSATGGNLVVVNGATDITVNTGLLNFRVSKTAFRLFESIQIDRDNDTVVDDECLDSSALKGIAVIEGANEFVMSQSAPTRIVVEQSGPVRATILIEGEHRDALNAVKLDFICRISAWANLPYIKVQYSFKNMQGDGVPAASASAAAAQLAAYATADAMNVDMPFEFNATNPAAMFGGSSNDPTVGAMTAAEYAELLQTYAGTHDATDANNPQPAGYSAGTGDGSSDPLADTWATQNDTLIGFACSGKIANTGNRASGWAQLVGSDLRVTAVLRDFWQMYPKCLRVQGDGLLRVGLWPDAAANQLQVFAGSMRTHELLYSIERSGSLSAAVAMSRHNFLNDPPLGVCNPRHYKAAQVFGEIGVTNETLTDVAAYTSTSQPFVSSYLSEIITHMGDILVDRYDGNGTAVGHEYGFWHFGDGKTFTPAHGWENCNWEIARACLSWFATSGNLNMFWFADESVRHFRDVVVMHSDIGMRFDYTESGNPAVSGGKASQLGKTRYSPNNKQHDLGNYHLGEHHLDVFKGAFLAEHYLLTGDALSLDILKECFTYLRGTWKRFFDAGNGGVDSTMTAPTMWLSNALYIASAYRVANGLNDPAANTIAAYVWNAVRLRQATTSPRDPNGNGFDDSSGNFEAYKIGHLAEAMEYSTYALEIPNIQVFLLDMMNWLLGTNAQVYLGNLPTPQFGKFALVPGGAVDYGGPNLMIGAGYGAAYRQSGQVNWRTAAQNLLSAQEPNIEATTIGDDGIRHSTFAQYFRGGPMLLAALMN